jgi:hypothetical protein
MGNNIMKTPELIESINDAFNVYFPDSTCKDYDKAQQQLKLALEYMDIEGKLTDRAIEMSSNTSGFGPLTVMMSLQQDLTILQADLDYSKFISSRLKIFRQVFHNDSLEALESIYETIRTIEIIQPSPLEPQKLIELNTRFAERINNLRIRLGLIPSN